MTTRWPSTTTLGATKPVKYIGLLPTDFYPVAVQYDKTIGKVVVTNDKGIGARGPDSTVVEKGGGTAPGASSVVGHNTYDDTGTITTFTMPSTAALAKDTHQVFVDNGWEKLLSAKPIKNSTAAPVAIPAHLGRPVEDQARLPDRQGEPHLRPGARRHRQGQQRPVAGPVRRDDHAERAQAGRRLRPDGQLLRRGHAVGRRPQLADAGRRQRLHREGIRRVLPQLPGAGR